MQCRRGMLELDFILEKFVTQQYDQLNPDQKARLQNRVGLVRATGEPASDAAWS